MTPVRASFVSPSFVPPLFALETPEMRAIVEGMRGSALPSEGRGQRFESSWVRQFSANFKKPSGMSFVLPLALRPDVAVAFRSRSWPDRLRAIDL